MTSLEDKENKDFPIMPNITDASLAPVPVPGEGKTGGPFSGVTANGLFTTIYDNKLMVVIIVLVIIIIGIMAYVVLNKTKPLEIITDGPPGQQQGALPPGQQPPGNTQPANQQKQPPSVPQQQQQQQPKQQAPQQSQAQPTQQPKQQSPPTNKTKMASHEQIRQAMKEIDSKQSKSKVEELPSETPRAQEYSPPQQMPAKEPVQLAPEHVDSDRYYEQTMQNSQDTFEITSHLADNTVHDIEGSPAISTCSYMLSTGKYCSNNSLANSDKCSRHQGEDI